MAKWEILSLERPYGQEFREFIPNEPRGKVIGRFSHYRVNENGRLIGLKVEGGPEMRIIGNTIIVEGYGKPWIAATPMRCNSDRKECAERVWQLIIEGKFEHHRIQEKKKRKRRWR